MEFYRAELPYYTCGFWVDNDRIVEAAPIMSWAVGRKLIDFMKWAYIKNGKVTSLGEEIAAELRSPHSNLVLRRPRGSNVGEPHPGPGEPPQVDSEPARGVSLDDVDKATQKIPEPTCYADYCKTYTVLPGGGIEEIPTDSSRMNR